MVEFLQEIYGDDKLKFRADCLKQNLDGSFHRKHDGKPDFKWILDNRLVVPSDFSKLDQKFDDWAGLFPDIKLPDTYRFYKK